MPSPRGRLEGAPKTGQRVGPYRLMTQLGEGHAGFVFRANREPDGESVALKVLRDELASDRLYRRRFEREAQIASELHHRHIVPVVDFGEASGHVYIATRFVQGTSLAERIGSQGALALSEVLQVADQLAQALGALHSRGLVHRDVKPANVLIDESGTAALTDFGLARAVEETVLTKPGMVVGTVDYLAPERIRGCPGAPASDIYAFGCLLYECISGVPPFAGRSLVETLLAHVNDEPLDLCSGRADLPESFCWAVMRALAKDPVKRPGTATAYARLMFASAESG